MKLSRFILLAALLARAAVGSLPAAETKTESLAWNSWSTDAFAQAKRESRFVILDLEAVWCHWCHVMDETTYRDPKVIALMKSRYLPIRVDQDARPDLSNRYEEYGWPATVIYAPDGSELVKRQGYITPEEMISLLQAVIDDPTPGPSVRRERAPTKSTATTLGERAPAVLAAWRDGYDDKAGGWGFSKKFLDWDNLELALYRAARGDAKAEAMARETLRLQRKLLDPVWGGVYQYSVSGDWNEPHFEKIMQMQAENLRIYAQAYAQWNDPVYLETAQAIHHYLRTFLTSPDGVVYTSQDADLVPGEHSADYFALDDTARRARGVPRVDQQVYARENGWVIVALVQLAEATGDRTYRDEAERAAKWAVAHRSLAGGGFRHDERDAAGPYLGDTLAMGRAFLALYQLTADAAWLQRAADAGVFIRTHFEGGEIPGYASSDTTARTMPAPLPQFDENVALARFGAALVRATGREEFRGLVDGALRWVLSAEVVQSRHAYVGALLLAEEEARLDPLHIAVVGPKDDPAAQALFAAALRAPEAGKLVEWWDRREGPAQRGENIYPELDRAAAFVCANGACSLPIFDTAALKTRLAKAAK